MYTNEMAKWLSKKEEIKYGNYIDGEWVFSSKTFKVTNPATKEVLGLFAESSQEEVDRAVNSAARSFQEWSKFSPFERGEILLKIADLLEQNKDELSFMISAEQGKPLDESVGEVTRSIKETKFTATEAFRTNGETFSSEKSNSVSFTQKYPIGVVAAIAPWNFPLITPIRKIVPALSYGCTVVFKPSSDTPWTSARLMEILSESGVIKGAVNYITGKGSNVGTPLVNHQLVKGISFTGSTKIGKKINEDASSRMAKTQLELGGKNPAIVLDYSNLEYAAKQIVGAAFSCSGQRCTSISRVIVVKEHEKQLLEFLTKEMKNIKIGPAWREGINMGPLTSKDQFDRTLFYIESGIEEGAKLLTGGETLEKEEFSKGYYITPALFTDVTEEMKIAKEEIFGPVLSVIPVNNKKEALRIANSVDYGLAASVFTDQVEEAHESMDKLQVGMVHVNHGTASEPHIPFGGWKDSGYGAFSIGSTNKDFFTNLKTNYII